jgi:hypothetical protein
MKAKIKVKNGYWTYNGVPVKSCSFPIQQLVTSFIKTQMFNNEVKPAPVSRPTEIIIDPNLFIAPNFVIV